MSKARTSFVQPRTSSTNWMLSLRKIGLSFLVVSGFAAYALHERLDTAVVAPSTTSGNPSTSQNTAAGNTPANNTSANNAPTASSPAIAGSFKDGTYTGPSVDAYYGNVQVKAVIQGGKITSVQFLDYPHDRRTSQEINSQAMPWLTNEAIQVQNAQVDIISGATFTSQGFTQSLQAALQQAQG